MKPTSLSRPYPTTYRAKEISIICDWIASGVSGSVVGLWGSGRGNVLDYLCEHTTDILKQYLPQRASSVVIVPLDLNTLPVTNLTNFYRAIIRAFQRGSDKFEPSLADQINQHHAANLRERDPFVVQTALQDLLQQCRTQQLSIILVLDHFDQFCQQAEPYLLNNLKALRDEFKDILSYIAGMSQEVIYFQDPTVLGEMYQLLDSFVCWVGPMTDDDAISIIRQLLEPSSMWSTEDELKQLFSLSGNYPTMLKAIAQWWLTTREKPSLNDWPEALLKSRSIQHRLTKIWTGLTQEEQFVLSELHKQTIVVKPQKTKQQKSDGTAQFVQQHHNILTTLQLKGICELAESGWYIQGKLFAMFVGELQGRSRGRIWLDSKTSEIYQGQNRLDTLSSLERDVLTYFLQHPYIQHTKTDIIFSNWPDELKKYGVSDNSLYQVIFAIRQVIEPNPGHPVYLINWRRKPEGGYQFFPEGRPS